VIKSWRSTSRWRTDQPDRLTIDLDFNREGLLYVHVNFRRLNLDDRCVGIVVPPDDVRFKPEYDTHRAVDWSGTALAVSPGVQGELRTRKGDADADLSVDDGGARVGWAAAPALAACVVGTAGRRRREHGATFCTSLRRRRLTAGIPRGAGAAARFVLPPPRRGCARTSR
jgi:hypothetical protein